MFLVYIWVDLRGFGKRELPMCGVQCPAVVCSGLQGPEGLACQEALQSPCASIGQGEGPSLLGWGSRVTSFLSQNWAEGDAKRRPSGEVKGMGWSQVAGV